MSEDEKKLKTGMVGPHQKKVSWASWIDSVEQIIGMYQSRGQSQFEQGVMAPRGKPRTAKFPSPARRKRRLRPKDNGAKR